MILGSAWAADRAAVQLWVGYVPAAAGAAAGAAGAAGAAAGAAAAANDKGGALATAFLAEPLGESAFMKRPAALFTFLTVCTVWS